MKIYILMLSILFLSCDHKSNERNKISTAENYDTTFDTTPKHEKTIEIQELNRTDTIEIFQDSTSFGKPKRHKIILTKLVLKDSSFIQLKLFSKMNSDWIKIDEISIVNSAISELNPVFYDFNNDGFKDVIFISGTAARGANLVQTLVLFDAIKNKLKRIVNSEEYPNLKYNKKLKCVDALIFTGGLTTVFLKIEKDKLIEFAQVDQRNDFITVEIIDKKGKRKTINKLENVEFSEMARFISFDPLEERLSD